MVGKRPSHKLPSTPLRRNPSRENKVVPSTPSTARYPLSPDSVAGDDSSVRSQSSYISSADSQRGLSSHLKKQLLIDIEKAGGIKNLTQPVAYKFSKSLQRILDQRPETYGKVADSKRAQIQQQVWRWKKLEKEGDK